MQWPRAAQSVDRLQVRILANIVFTLHLITSQVLAAFLVTRGPYAFIGYGWNGGMPEWDPMWYSAY